MIDFICKKTNELSSEELEQLSNLFEQVFHKKRSVSFLLNQYIYNVLGYSYHSLMIDNGIIVGLNTYVPSYYYIENKKLLFANSTDSMVLKPYRDFFNFNDMVNTAYSYLKAEGVSFVYGFPNDNSFPVLCKSKLMKNIGLMNIYCLPYRIGGIKQTTKGLNLLSILLSKLYLNINRVLASSKNHDFHIRKDNQTFNLTRYKRADGNYKQIKYEDTLCTYKIMVYENIRTAFIIDVYPKSASNFVKSIKYIIKNHSQEFDLILYPGYLPFKHLGLIKIPRRFEPKKFHFTGHILDKSSISDSVWSINNWDINLSNYDLI